LHERYGGWLDVQESQKDFERYARLCYERFGDRVKHWITLNEPWIVSIFVSGFLPYIFPSLLVANHGSRAMQLEAMRQDEAASILSPLKATHQRNHGLLARLLS